MALSANIDEVYFHSVLDRGLQQLKKPQVSSVELSVPRKSFSKSDSAYREASRIVQKNESSEFVQSELSALKARLIALESTMRKPSQSYAVMESNPPKHTHKPSKGSNVSLRSSLKNGSVDYFLKDIERSEKEISQIEFSISRIAKAEFSIKQEHDQTNVELIELRRQHIELAKERETLIKKVAHRIDYQARLNSMQEDFASLKKSFDKSEEIRAKQRELIEQLKGELQILTESDKAQG
eukprot:CAMPEP_0204918348 /NCGR_PEP_ID=MMETSP1397-20131031/16094_1 /ASSEMBLY_ACC=CAM_ASM_000891 /TAXON_ID=49980 /ORGANISM="Climacostomum Climacostomum virens, Strain Stock W-24" /LENGTH=238 /DNA_ID=CAMNT_0052091609 /DNA_START=12 /DNA_END=724 /DNA_ORIENTATION=-